VRRGVLSLRATAPLSNGLCYWFRRLSFCLRSVTGSGLSFVFLSFRGLVFCLSCFYFCSGSSLFCRVFVSITFSILSMLLFRLCYCSVGLWSRSTSFSAPVMSLFRWVSGLCYCFCVSSFCCFLAFPAPAVDLELWFGFWSSNGVLGVILGALVCIRSEGIGRFRSSDGVLVSARRRCTVLVFFLVHCSGEAEVLDLFWIRR
jgi:hypothetical protein